MPGESTQPVRYDDVDTNGHVRGPAYLTYADHARWELVRTAGVDLEALARRRVGPINLETTVRFRSELRLGDAVAVSTSFTYDGRTGGARQELRRVADGALVAEVTSVTGMLDLDRRRLVDDHAAAMRAAASDPGLLGL